MNNKTSKKTRRIVNAGIIAAIYTVMTIFANALGLASGAIQVRLSEALTVLPVFLPEAVPGLAIGCMISNIITGCIPIDIVFGTFATLIGAYGTYALRRTIPLAIICPVVSNTIIVPLVLKFAYGLGDAWWYLAVTVGAGELISCVILGGLLLKIIKKHKIFK